MKKRQHRSRSSSDESRGEPEHRGQQRQRARGQPDIDRLETRKKPRVESEASPPRKQRPRSLSPEEDTRVRRKRQMTESDQVNKWGVI